MPENSYLDTIYPLQDKILKAIETLDLDFYLTGGTALGRCYLNHRYSDDLDLFVNNHPDFKKQCNHAVQTLKKGWTCDVTATSDAFVRVFVQSRNINLKIDFVNDVPCHFGAIQPSPIFHRVDSWRNILSNKLCALSRLEVKDIVDIVFIAKNYAFDWETILYEAKEKDLWVEPIDVCRTIRQFPTDLLSTIKWIGNIDLEELKQHIDVVHDEIFTGVANSLFSSDSSLA